MNGTNVRMRLSDSIGELRRLRDELRLEIHLARLEALERWRSFEPRLHQAERFAKDAMGGISDKLRQSRS